MIYNIFYDIILNKNEIIIIKRPNCRRIIFDICSLCLALSLSLNICIKNYFAVFEMQSLSIFCIYIERISKIFSLFLFVIAVPSKSEAYFIHHQGKHSNTLPEKSTKSK